MNLTGKHMNTPILLICWRRPHTLKLVIDAIRLVAPTRLYVACDGPDPARPGEEQKVFETRAVVEHHVDWPCSITRFYSDVNQGCRLGVTRAIDWFFKHVDEGIILEDDCIPHPDFFVFCTSLLNYYRNDTRIWCISGNNFSDGACIGDDSYCFSQIPMVWGWATWSDRWWKYERDLIHWPEFLEMGLMRSAFQDGPMRRYWFRIWQRLYDTGHPDTWDYQWVFTCIINGGLTALPSNNLVSNIGFDHDATHTFKGRIRLSMGLGDQDLLHPSFVIGNAAVDQYIFDNAFRGRWKRFPLILLDYLIRCCHLFFRLLRFTSLKLWT
jgi:hypothetical protein